MGAGHGRATRLFELEDSDCARTMVTVSLYLARSGGVGDGVGIGLAGELAAVISGKVGNTCRLGRGKARASLHTLRCPDTRAHGYVDE